MTFGVLVGVLLLCTMSARATTVRGTSSYGGPGEPASTTLSSQSFDGGFTEEVVCTKQNSPCGSGNDYDLFILTPILSTGDVVTVDVPTADLDASGEAEFFACETNSAAACTTPIGSTDCDGLPCPTAPSACMDPVSGTTTTSLKVQTNGSDSAFSFVVPSSCAGYTVGLFFDETTASYATSASDVAGTVSAPEPSSLALLAIGIFGLLPLRRRLA